MSTTSEVRPDADLPVLPGPRAARGPLAPPAESGDLREQPGSHKAIFQGSPIWMVGRYQDMMIEKGAPADVVLEFALRVPSLVIGRGSKHPKASSTIGRLR